MQASVDTLRSYIDKGHRIYGISPLLFITASF
jgi:hypothetical protein